nr:MAG TPA: hypothetical protein [Bacteriophage sp.]
MTPYLMNYLEKAEGTTVHRNSTESDITSPYGIYKSAHPTAQIFTFIDQIAKEAGIFKSSQQWTQNDLNLINQNIQRTNKLPQIRSLAESFYDKYTQGLPLDKIPELCQVTVFSLYTNSSLNASKAIQMACNSFIKNYSLQIASLVEDGALGRSSISALENINRCIGINTDRALYFETLILLHMSKLYATLAVANPDKYLIYLKGWNNRLETLSRS